MSTPDLSIEATTLSELATSSSSLAYRQHQMFPRLSAAEIQSLRRFARPMSFKAGELIFETGHVALGLFVLLHGRVKAKLNGWLRLLPWKICAAPFWWWRGRLRRK